MLTTFPCSPRDPAHDIRINRGALALLFGALVLAGCGTTVQPGAQGADRVARETVREVAPWWDALSDEQLDALVAKAMSRNLDIHLALARLDEAEAGARGAGASLLPRVDAEGFSGRAADEGAGPARSDSASLRVGWTIDLFGADRSTRRAAIARMEAARFSAEATRLVVSGMVTEAYVELRAAQRELSLTRQSITSRKTTLDLVRAAFDQGAASRLDVLQAEQLVVAAQASVPMLEAQITAAHQRLATLIDAPAADLHPLVAAGAGIPRPKADLSKGLAADLLRQRPDILAAEQAYAAAMAEVGVAKAALYPSLSLTGMVTEASFGNASMPRSWSFGPAIKLPIFTGGALTSNLSAAEARAEQARLTWQASILAAAEETAVSLSSLKRAGQSVASQARLVELATEAVDLGRESLEAGSIDILGLLEAERDLLAARVALAQAERSRALAFVSLSMATVGAASGDNR